MFQQPLGALFLLAAAAAVSPAAWAADLTGKWEASVDTSAGSGSPTFVFKQDGEKLTGDYSGALGAAKLAGSVKGSAVEFKFQADAGGESVVVEYKGTVEADGKSMKGTVKLGSLADGTFTAKRQ